MVKNSRSIEVPCGKADSRLCIADKRMKKGVFHEA